MKRNINKAIIIFTLFIGALCTVFCGKNRGNFYGDALGYYIYLPSVFILDNLKEPEKLPDQAIVNAPRQKIRDYLVQIIITPKGYLMNQYTYGVALMELPFFLIAHGYEKISGLPAVGFSPVYDALINVSTLFYAVLGLYILYLCLKRFFSETHSLIGLCIITVGTNFLWFATIQAGMAHIIIFFLVSSLLYLTIRIYETPRTLFFLLAGLTIGLIALIRPTDVILIAIPLLYKVTGWQSLKEKFGFIYLHKWKIIGAAFLAFLLAVPQFLYWKELTGHYIFYSYGENQKFHWRHPHIYDGLFSYQNGWLIYSPVMTLSVIGLLCVRSLKSFYLLMVCLLPVYIYVIYAWYCYNYINGLGSRPMINIYPLLAFPLVALVAFMARQRRVYIILFTALVLFLSAVSISYCIQQDKGTLWSENSKKAFNLHTMFRYKLDYNDIILYDNEVIQPDQAGLRYHSTLDSEDFEHTDDPNIVTDTFWKSRFYHLPEGQEYPERALEYRYDAAKHKNAKWIKLSGMFNAPHYCGFYNSQLIVLEIKSDTGIIYWKSCVINNKIGLATTPAPAEGYTLFDNRLNLWGAVYFFAPIPDYIKDGDNIRMLIWSIRKREFLMDDLKLELYQ